MSSNAQHTPGPWETSAGAYDDYTDGCAWEIIDGADQIASICDGPNAEGNARLIAAAPDLLEALEDVMNMRSQCFIPNEGDWWDDKARAAIAKAKGQ